MSDTDPNTSADGTQDPANGLRDQVRAILQMERLSQAALAREAAIAPSTFAAWMLDKYPGDKAKITADVGKWLATRNAARKRAKTLPVEVPFQETPTALRIREALQYAHLMPAISVVACGSGVGKTVTCRHYKATNSRVHVATMNASVKSVQMMLTKVAIAVGVTKSTPSERADLICQRLGGGSALLIIDEAQWLVHEQIEMLRALYDEVGCGLALVGNQHTANRRGTSDLAAAQVESRIGWEMKVDAPTAEDVRVLLAARGITDETVLAILTRVGVLPGALRQMTQALYAASVMAVGAGADAVEASHIRAALRERGIAVPAV